MPRKRLDAGLSIRKAITPVQAGIQTNQFTSGIDHAGNITNFTKNCAGKSFFSSRLKGDFS